eukprot:m51a1_g8308 hypothetical protein (476) ;mRNA; f:70882-72613
MMCATSAATEVAESPRGAGVCDGGLPSPPAGRQGLQNSLLYLSVLSRQPPPTTATPAPAFTPGTPLEAAGEEPAEFFEAVDFLMALTGALQRYGVPTDRLEHQITWAAYTRCIEATVVVFPTYVATSFRLRWFHESYSYNIANEFSWDLSKQELADSLAKRFSAGKISLADAACELKAIIERFLSVAAMSVAFCPMFFGGGLWEMVPATIAGILSGGLVLLADRSYYFARLFETVHGIVIAALVALLQRTRWLGPLNYGGVLMAGIVWSLPGLHLIKSVGDIAGHMVVAGMSRLLYGLLVVFELAFGIAVGNKIIEIAVPEANSTADSASIPTVPLTPWLSVFWLPVAATTIAVALGASVQQFPAINAACATALVASLLGQPLGNEICTVASMAALAMVSNAYSRAYDKPAAILTTTGSLLLVPSSLGVRGMTNAIMGDNFETALEFVWGMLMIVVSITIGNIIANVILFPRRRF